MDKRVNKIGTQMEFEGENVSNDEISKKIKEWDKYKWKQELEGKVSLSIYKERRLKVRKKYMTIEKVSIILLKCRYYCSFNQYTTRHSTHSHGLAHTSTSIPNPSVPFWKLIITSGQNSG